MRTLALVNSINAVIAWAMFLRELRRRRRHEAVDAAAEVERRKTWISMGYQSGLVDVKRRVRLVLETTVDYRDHPPSAAYARGWTQACRMVRVAIGDDR